MYFLAFLNASTRPTGTARGLRTAVGDSVFKSEMDLTCVGRVQPRSVDIYGQSVPTLRCVSFDSCGSDAVLVHATPTRAVVSSLLLHGACHGRPSAFRRPRQQEKLFEDSKWHRPFTCSPRRATTYARKITMRACSSFLQSFLGTRSGLCAAAAAPDVN